MEGIIKNNGAPVFIFKRKFSTGHTVTVAELWGMYKKKASAQLGGRNVVPEAEFVAWLHDSHYMLPQFSYVPGEQPSLVVEERAAAAHEELDIPGECDAVTVDKPSLSHAPYKVIQSLTYKDIAALRLVDDPPRIISSITSISKLRRAYSVVRSLPKKRRLEKILRERIQELERM